MAASPLGGFIAMKAPTTLDGGEGGPEDEEDVFTPSMFMERQVEKGRQIGLVIDLTAPPQGGKRMYEAEEWEDWDVKYATLPCAPSLPSPVAEAVPPEDVCAAFISACSNFWREEKNHRRYIAVHCLTGFNLSGYMIVRYLLQRGPLLKALSLFSAHRPPGIYSIEILEALFKHSGTPLPQPQQWKPPPPPPWHPLPQRAFGKPAVPLFDAFPSAARTSTHDNSCKRPRCEAPTLPSAAGGSESQPQEGSEVGGEREGSSSVGALLNAVGDACRLPTMSWPRKGTSVWRFLCHDLLALEGQPITEQPLQKRLALLESELLAPRKATGIDLSSEKLRVRKKDCYRLKYIPYLLKQFIPKLTHAANGLVLLPSDVPFQVE
ncbi:MAG: hypothetical protein SGPRY_013406, partial [Prymnesium sp.]